MTRWRNQDEEGRAYVIIAIKKKKYGKDCKKYNVRQWVSGLHTEALETVEIGVQEITDFRNPSVWN